MGLFGNMFEKKNCSICGEEIKLLGNRKLEDGNMCKNCADKLSPWFDERRHSTIDQIKEQLAYREANKPKAAAFRATRTFGKGGTKLYIDLNNQQFAVTKSKNFAADNPDILDTIQAISCDLDIKENRRELKHTVDGRSVSYNPPRYEYNYDFKVTIHVNHPYFNEMEFNLNSGSVHTGEHRMTGMLDSAWRVNTVTTGSHERGINDYYEYVNMGNELKKMLTDARGNQMLNQMYETINTMHQNAVMEQQNMAAQNMNSFNTMNNANAINSAPVNNPAPQVSASPVTCPYCGSSVIPTADGHCTVCSAPLS